MKNKENPMMTRLGSTFSLLLLSVAACTAGDEPLISEGEVASALELENGGLDTEDEAPMFGSEDLYQAAAIEADREFTDPMAGAPEVVALRDRSDVGRHRIAILWGQLPPDRERERAKDWTGTLALSRGAMVVRRTIGFEDGTDVLSARSTREIVGFSSLTKPFADGLALSVYDPEPTLEALTLTYDGAAGLHVIDLGALAAGPVVIEVDADGNKLMAVSLRGDDTCDHGFMRGRWHQLRANLGVYLGTVANADGEPIGHLRGVYGVRRDGQHVMFGKYIGSDGQFAGLFAGRYLDGEFAGRWLSREGEVGRFHGLYRERQQDERIGGGFVGRWAETRCAADLPADR
jgi:hypothetical protein